ncbi:MAG: hypothetical protein ACFE94_13055 [Candidatus Hodarchaeota archaeon]
MRKKILIMLVILSFLGGSFMAFIPSTTASGTSRIIKDRVPMDFTPDMLGEEELAIRREAAKFGSASATQASPIGEAAEIGDPFTFELSDDYYGGYDEDFIVLMKGVHSLILITQDAYDSFDGTYYNFSNPYGTWGRYGDLITDAQLEGLMTEFDTNIYPTVTGVFGEPLPRGDEGQKVWILIFNIRDESYYDDSQTSYAVGYFSASTSAEYNKNIFHCDTYDWENNAGPGSDRTMEGAFAHEFEHLVHFDQDPDEPSWVDEGLADLAIYLCGYGHWASHIWNYLAYHWFTSLIFWGNGLEDYGASYLFILYLFEHFGGADFIVDLVQEQANGIEGIQKTLYAHGYCISFDRIFDRWTIANYLDDTSRWGGKYGYETLEMGGPDTWFWTLDDILTYGYGEPIFSGDWELTGWWGTPQPYTAHYYRFTTDTFAKVYMEGDIFSGVTAYSGTLEWYSGANAWAWRSFSQTFTIPEDGATLNFMTYFEIEDDWDYGYVEVHDLTDDVWVTLNDPNARMYVYNLTLHAYEYVPMRTFVDQPQDNPNTPDEQEPTTYETDGTWFGFTGLSGGWIPISMDLSAFKGHQIEIHFRLWQDGAFTLQNMYVDDIEITNGVFPLDDVEAGEDGWATTGWYVTDGILYNDWEVTVINVKYGEWPAMHMKWARRMHVRYGTQTGRMWVTKSRGDYFYMAIVSNRADHILTSNYLIGVEHFTWKGSKK